jgi:hypothetical protein
VLEAASAARMKQWRRRATTAFVLGVANGMLWNFASAFVNDSTVLPTFVRELGGGAVLVGLIPLVAVVCWNLPQLVAANMLQAARRHMPMYRTSSLLRALAWPGAAIATLHWADQSRPLVLAAFFAMYALFMLSGGFGGMAFTSVVARTIPATRLGLFFGLRQMGGGLLGVAAGVIVWRVLRDANESVGNYATLFIWASAIFVAGWILFALISEPDPAPARPREPMGRFFAQACALIKTDPDFRRLFVVRMLQSVALMGVPFYVVYCREVLRVPRQMVGVYLLAQMVGMIVSNLVWAPLSDRGGNRLVLRVLGADILLATALAAVFSLIGRQGLGFGFPLVFFLLGTLSSGSVIGNTNYLLEMAPIVSTPLYVAAMNTFMALGAASSLVAGKLIELIGFHFVFVAAAALGAASFAATARLREPRSFI